MADYSKFKNANGDDLVLQDSRVDAISEKVEGIETGAEVNKIESISISINDSESTELVPDDNKNVNINLGGGSGGLDYTSEDGLYIPTHQPLYCGYADRGIFLGYDDSTLELNDDKELTVVNPVPDIDEANDGDVLSYVDGEIVWMEPKESPIPEEPGETSHLMYNGATEKIEWWSMDELKTKAGIGLTSDGSAAPTIGIDTDGANDGYILTYNASTSNVVWKAPQIPSYTTADAGKVLAVNAAGTGLEWISLVPANAVGVNNEPVGVNGDYVTVGE